MRDYRVNMDAVDLARRQPPIVIKVSFHNMKRFKAALLVLRVAIYLAAWIGGVNARAEGDNGQTDQ